MREVVTHVRMHSTIHVAGVGELGTTLPSSSKSYKLDMSYLEGEAVIKVTINGIHARIPLTNVQCFISAAPESPKASK